jgi:hypothetical protein
LLREADRYLQSKPIPWSNLGLSQRILICIGALEGFFRAEFHLPVTKPEPSTKLDM